MGFADRLARQAATRASQVASKAVAFSRADVRNDDIFADVDLSDQASQLGDEVDGVGGRSVVVPEQSGPNQGAVVIESDHAMLLAPHSYGLHILEESAVLSG